MTPPEQPVPSAKAVQRWFPRVRFSLRTLLLLVLLIASGGTLWWNWGPWRVSRVLPEQRNEIKTAAISADGSWVMTTFDSVGRIKGAQRGAVNSTDDQNQIQFWRTADGTLLKSFAGGYPASPDALGGASTALSPNERWVQMSSLDGMSHFEKIWDRETGEELTFPEKNSVEGLPFPGFVSSSFWCQKFSTDDRYIAIERSAGISVFDAKSRVCEFVSPTTRIPAGCSFSADGRFLSAVPDDKSVLLWNVAEHRIEWVTNLGLDPSKIYWCESAFSPDASMLAVWTHNLQPNQTKIFSVKTGELNQSLTGSCPQSSSESVMPSNSRGPFSPDGTRIVTVGEDGASVWDIKTGAHLLTFPLSNNWDSWKVICAFSPDGKRIISVETDTPKAWSALTGEALPLLNSDRRCIFPRAFSSDGKWMVWKNGKHADIWRLTRREQWWGVISLFEFWLTVVLGAGLVWSFWSDRRLGRRP